MENFPDTQNKEKARDIFSAKKKFVSLLFVFLHFVSIGCLLFNLKRNLCLTLDSNFSGWSISQNLSKELIVTANAIGHS